MVNGEYPLGETASAHGEFWSKAAKDWAELQEQTGLPLHSAVLDAARVRRGSSVLDAGCGSGTAALLASLRGATVVAVDAAAELVSLAKERVPNATVAQADLQSLPLEDERFDAIVCTNSLFYAADPLTATQELARVMRAGGRMAIATWGPPERCEYAQVLHAVGRLMPPPPAGVTPGGPFAYSAPGALEALIENAGLKLVERGETACPFVYPTESISLEAHLSSGVVQRAVEHSGLSAVTTALQAVDSQYRQPHGSVRYENTFIWVVATR